MEKGKNYGWPVVHHRGLGGGDGLAAARVHARRRARRSIVLTGKALPSFQGDFFFANLRGEVLIRVRFDPRTPGGFSRRKSSFGTCTAGCATSSPGPTGRSTSPRATVTAADAPARATTASCGLSKPFPCIRFACLPMELAEVVGQLAVLRRFPVRALGGESPDEASSRARAWPGTGSTTSSTRAGRAAEYGRRAVSPALPRPVPRFDGPGHGALGLGAHHDAGRRRDAL